MKQIYAVAIDPKTKRPTLYAVDAKFMPKTVRLSKRLKAWGYAELLSRNVVHTTPEAAIMAWRTECEAQVQDCIEALAEAKLRAAAPIEGAKP